MISKRPLLTAFIWFSCVSLFGTLAAAGIVRVPSTSSGGFGAPVSGATSFVEAFTLDAGQAVIITASGVVSTGAGAPNSTPDGVTVNRSIIKGVFPEGYTPLEEVLIDSGSDPNSDLPSTIVDTFALIGTFVSLSTANDPNFLAFDEDITPLRIASDSLFKVGSGPYSFVATFNGKLYLGFNEPFVSNNSGNYTVNISLVPEPNTLLLGALASLGLLMRRRSLR